MPPEQELMLKLTDTIMLALTSKIHYLLFAVICLGVAGYLLKFVVSNVAGYIIFTIDKHLSVDTAIRLFDGRFGVIKAYSIFSGVTVETETTFKTIPWGEWQGSYETIKKKSKLK